MTDYYVQGAFAFACTAAESALIEEAWQHAADLMDDAPPGEPSAAFLAAFVPTKPANPFSGLLSIFFDPAFPDFGADIEIAGAAMCTVSIFGTVDFQPEPIARLIQHCCRETLQDAPIAFEWSYSCSKARSDGFGGGWCAVFPDCVEFETTRGRLQRAIRLRKAEPANTLVPSNPWIDHPDHPSADWITEVANHDTRLGYADWVAARLEALIEDPTTR